MLREIIEYDHKIEEEVKAMKNEIKENVQRTSITGMKLGLISTVWSRKKK